MKGITPVIAIVMLMVITIGMVGLAYTWFSGMLSSQTMMVSIPPNGAWCSGTIPSISLIIRNDATVNLDTENDLTLINVDGIDISGAAEVIHDTILPGKAHMLIQAYDCGDAVNGCSESSHTIRIGTPAGIIESTVLCR